MNSSTDNTFPLWLRQLPCGALETNAYLCGLLDSTETVLIDAPPDSKDAVEYTLAQAKRELTAVIITHPHFDHILDAAAFSADGVPVYAHPDAVDGIQHPDTLGFFPEPPGGFPQCSSIEFLPVGSDFSIAGLNFKIMNVPGHSEGSAALYFDDPQMPFCFVGDLIFRGSVGRTDLPDASFSVLTQSIQNCIYTLPEHTVLLPGHGPSTDVAFEKKHNPFVKG